MLMWQVTVQVVGVAQWLASMWPSHGLPRGSGKMPNEGPRTEISKKKKGGSAKSGGTPPDLVAQREYLNHLQSW
jgi:hypothetical protein